MWYTGDLTHAYSYMIPGFLRPDLIFLFLFPIFLAATHICYARTREYPNIVDNYSDATY